MKYCQYSGIERISTSVMDLIGTKMTPRQDIYSSLKSDDCKFCEDEG